MELVALSREFSQILEHLAPPSSSDVPRTASTILKHTCLLACSRPLVTCKCSFAIFSVQLSWFPESPGMLQPWGLDQLIGGIE